MRKEAFEKEACFLVPKETQNNVKRDQEYVKRRLREKRPIALSFQLNEHYKSTHIVIYIPYIPAQRARLLRQKRPRTCQTRPRTCRKRPRICQKRPRICQKKPVKKRGLLHTPASSATSSINTYIQ